MECHERYILPMDLSPALDRSPWYRRQPEELRKAIRQEGRAASLAAGQMAYLEGDASTGLWIVLEGLLRLELAIGPDRVALVGLAPAGAVFGRSRTGGAAARIVSARAAHATRALQLSDAAIARIADRDGRMWRALGEAVQSQLDTTLVALGQLLCLPPAGRIAARLLMLGQSGAADVTQSDLAELTGLSRKVVNGHLGAMAKAGLVQRSYRRIAISDPAGLARLAGMG